MAPYTMKGPLLPLLERDFQEPGKFLVAGTSGTAVLAALLVEPPGINLILWLLLFITAVTAGYLYRERGIVAATVLGLACLGITVLRAYPHPAIFLPFVAMVALASLASTVGYSTR